MHTQGMKVKVSRPLRKKDPRIMLITVYSDLPSGPNINQKYLLNTLKCSGSFKTEGCNLDKADKVLIVLELTFWSLKFDAYPGEGAAV